VVVTRDNIGYYTSIFPNVKHKFQVCRIF
jgi:hypothetical protein